MTPRALLECVEALHVSISIEGDRLGLTPASSLPDELLVDLKENKAAIIQLLDRDSALGQALGGVVEAEPSLYAADICSMPLEEFANARLVVAVRSSVLNEVVVFASDNATIDPGERRVVYRANELEQLLHLGEAHLRSVHRIKKLFGGTVLPS